MLEAKVCRGKATEENQAQSLEPGATKRSWGFLERLYVRFMLVSVRKELSFLSSGAPSAFLLFADKVFCSYNTLGASGQRVL